jgi:tetratricopeptide (TPR) repeat protein
LWRSEPRPAKLFDRSPALSLGVGLAAAILAGGIIVGVNLQTVQADTYYKQGLGYEAAGQWEGAVVLYREAALLEPEEDYYYLFLGRALLQLADVAPTGSAVLPENLDGLAHQDLLTMVEHGVRAGNREDVLRAAYAALLAARQLNPLNTDHSANLARLYRAWAFIDAVGPEGLANNSRLREEIQLNSQAVNLSRLNRSEEFYRQAVSLSPNNAVLWNELATVQFIKGDLASGQASIDHSLAVDERYAPTHLLQGDLLDAQGNQAGALIAYRRAAELASRDLTMLSALGIYEAQAGDTIAAVAAFQRIVAIQSTALDATQTQLDQLDARAARAGGYTMLLSSAANQRDALQAQIASRRSQISLSYRNIALVWRDASRLTDALDAAQKALSYADTTSQPTLEALIADLKKQLGP